MASTLQTASPWPCHAFKIPSLQLWASASVTENVSGCVIISTRQHCGAGIYKYIYSCVLGLSVCAGLAQVPRHQENDLFSDGFSTNMCLQRCNECRETLHQFGTSAPPSRPPPPEVISLTFGWLGWQADRQTDRHKCVLTVSFLLNDNYTFCCFCLLYKCFMSSHRGFKRRDNDSSVCVYECACVLGVA